MSPIPPRRHGHGVVTTAVVALACTLAPSVLADPVDQSDIDRSKASERSTSTSIASLEAQLAEQSTTLEQAQIRAQVANEDYLTAVDDLSTATTEAQTAQTNADTAASSTAAARSDLERRARRQATLSVTLPGRTDVVAEGQLVLAGFRDGVNGTWTVTRAEHSLDGSGYVTSVEAEWPTETAAAKAGTTAGTPPSAAPAGAAPAPAAPKPTAPPAA